MPKHLIPDAALDNHVVLFGMTGAGKSSVIRAAIVEPDLDAGRRVGVITPKDDWWGLRLSKSGKSKGYDIPIFGGRHGDYPLQVKDAALLAETYGTMKGSAIFCTSLLSGQDRARWFAAFAETLLHKNRGWMRLVIDEAHVFMPKQGAKGGGAIPMGLHAGNELVSQGRSPGLRIVLASQRSAKLHNDASSQCHCLFAMQLMSPADRQAVKDWIEDQADPVKGKEIIASLSDLNPGQAWVWAPRVKMLEKVQFPRPHTFDSSAPPAEDDGDGPVLAPINLDALKGKLATVEAERKANDPKELKAENAKLKAEKADLERQMADAVAAKVVADPDELKKAEERGFNQAKKKLAHATAKEIKDSIALTLHEILASFDPPMKALKQAIKEASATAPPVADRITFEPTFMPRAPIIRPAQSARAQPPVMGNGATGPLNRPLQKIVDSIRWWNVMSIARPSQAQVAFVAGYSHKSGTWATYLSQLRKDELIDGSRELTLTHSGAAMANEPPAAPTRDALHAAVRAKLDAPLNRILTPLLEAYPQALPQQEAGDAAGYSSTSGTWATYLSRLRSLDLIEGSRELKAQEWLFP